MTERIKISDIATYASPASSIGKRITITDEEVRKLLRGLRTIGSKFHKKLEAKL